MARRPRPPLNERRARAEIRRIVTTFQGLLPRAIAPVTKTVGGKLYELYALSRLLAELRSRGWHPTFSGQSIRLNSGPGLINPRQSHFELRRYPGGPIEFEVYTDIEVGTLGAPANQPRDLSAYHEIDIVVVPANTAGRPSHDAIALGIECKATANFDKAFVREVLGRRRELSLLRDPEDCMLDQTVQVKADPPSEYWLVYIDPAGDNYRLSPAYFSVVLKHWQP